MSKIRLALLGHTKIFYTCEFVFRVGDYTAVAVYLISSIMSSSVSTNVRNRYNYARRLWAYIAIGHVLFRSVRRNFTQTSKFLKTFSSITALSRPFADIFL